ncbi:hypothetical protein AOQ84DRAFT_164952 [Glonium stellatum]|uniref:Uncharacterized protein n=1 Tax=Glonium stellatum TaxID=574774 RepID=A0A8E2JMV7_9PEZI|nr:hypothetical protein AOQ84DRAFT_164952 [Glonium stellatum]
MRPRHLGRWHRVHMFSCHWNGVANCADYLSRVSGWPKPRRVKTCPYLIDYDRRSVSARCGKKIYIIFLRFPIYDTGPLIKLPRRQPISTLGARMKSLISLHFKDA